VICRTAAAVLISGLSDGWRPTSTGSIESETHAVRCHWADAEDEARCDDVLRYIGNAWDVQVDAIGFQAPMLTDEDGVLDVYITDEYTYGGAYVYGPGTDEDPDDGLSGCHSYMALDPSIRDDELESYVAHEFQHVLQYATDFREPSYPIWEGVAEAATQWTLGPPYGDYTSPLFYAADFQEEPWAGILADSGILDVDYDLYSYYEYGSILWFLYLEQHFGDGTGSSAAELWMSMAQEGAPNEPDVIDAHDTLTGDWQEAVLGVQLERAWIATEANPAWAGDYDTPTLAVAITEVADGLPAELTPEIAPFATGVVYFQLEGLEDGEDLELVVDGSEDVDWGLVLTDGSTHATVLGATTTWTGTGVDPLTIGVVHLGAPEWDADSNIRKTQQDFTLHLQSLGLSGGDDGAGGGDEGTGGTGGDEDEARGCGCGSPLAPLPWLALPVLLGLAGRRRR